MSLIKCPECGRRNVSDSAEACPSCGYNIKTYFDKARYDTKNESKDDKRELEEEKQNLDKEVERIKEDIIPKKMQILLCVLFVLFLVAIKFVNAMIDQKKIEQDYITAVNQYKEGDYESSINYFQNSDYKDSISYLKLSKYELANQLLQNNQDIDKAYELLQELGNYQDSSNLLEQYYYLKGVNNYKNGIFDIAKEFFDLDNNYEDTEIYLNNIDKVLPLQGEWLWQSKNPYDNNIRGFVVDKWEITFYRDSDIMGVHSDAMTFDIDDVKENRVTFQTSIRRYELTFTGNLMEAEMIKDDIMYILKDESPITCKKEDFLCYIIKEEPKIGMTAEEVRASSWGSPEEINKDTYSWGVKEQWCYSGYKYIYLEDGIVTSISE